MFEQEIRQPPRAFRELAVRAPQDLPIGRDVVDGVGVWLNGRRALEEKSGRQLVQMVRVVESGGRLAADAAAAEVAEDVSQARSRSRHCQLLIRAFEVEHTLLQIATSVTSTPTTLQHV